MRKYDIKKIAALTCAAAMMSSMTACGENTRYSADIDGVQIPAGVFIYYLQSAYYDAEAKVQEEAASLQQDAAETTADGAPAPAPEIKLFSTPIEGKNAKDWIYDNATKEMQEFQAVEAKFDEYGLELSNEDKSAAKMYCDQMWEYYGSVLEGFGISEDSYLAIYLNSEKRSQLFEHLYSEGGEHGVPDSEIKTYLTDNYAQINYIEIELKDGEGNLLKSEGKAERMAMAEDYAARAKAGEDFDLLNAEYQAFYNNLVAEAAALTSEEDGTETAEVDLSDAQTANTEEETAVAETTVTEESAVDTAASAAEETTAEADETAAPEETSAPEATTSEETTAAETEAPAEAEAPAETPDMSSFESNKQVIQKDGTTPCAEVVEKVFGSMNYGDVEIIESADGEKYYVVTKIDILASDEYFMTAKMSLLNEMKDDDYTALVDTWVGTQNIVKNDAAYKRYDPEKMFAE